MATIGLDKLYYAPIEEDVNGNENYGTPIKLAKAISASLSIEVAEASLYADDTLSELTREFKSGTLSLGIDDIGVEAAQMLTGATIDNNGVLVFQTEDMPKPVAIGFRAKKADGSYRYFWLYKVVFTIPSTELTTKGDSISFATPNIEGTILRRNKPDSSGRHPWKVEIDEPRNITQSMQGAFRINHNKIEQVIQSWYDSVYEPSFAIPVTVSASNVEVGDTVTLSVSTDGDNNLMRSYAWFENDTNSNNGGIEILGANGPSYTTLVFSEPGEYYFYCITTKMGISIASQVAAVSVTEAMEQ